MRSRAAPLNGRLELAARIAKAPVNRRLVDAERGGNFGRRHLLELRENEHLPLGLPDLLEQLVQNLERLRLLERGVLPMRLPSGKSSRSTESR